MSSTASVASAPSDSLPPGPRNVLLATLRYFRDPFGFYAAMKRRYGLLFTLGALGGGNLVLTGEPEGAREIYSAPPRSFSDAFGAEMVEPLAGSGSLLVLSGDAHRRERQRMAPSFHGARMRAYAEPILATTLSIAGERLRPGAELRSLELFQRITLEVILRAVFGATEEEEVEELAGALTRAIDAASPALVFFPFLQHDFLGFGPWARLQRGRAEADALLFARIRAARATAEQRDDILSQTVAAAYEDGSRASDERIRDSLFTLTVAGHETTAGALAWCVYELHRNPDSLAKLRGELDALGPDPTPESLVALAYLDGVVRETLRLHPAIPDTLRIVKEGFELRGHRLPEGTGVGVSIPLIHSDPTLYPEPARFRPERFVERRFGPHEYVSFGGGHRHCIGSAFAMTEAKIVLGTLLSRFELALASDRPARAVRRGVVLAPGGGIPVRVTGRRGAFAAGGA